LDVDGEIVLSFEIISEMLVFYGNHFDPIHYNVFPHEQNFIYSILHFRAWGSLVVKALRF